VDEFRAEVSHTDHQAGVALIGALDLNAKQAVALAMSRAMEAPHVVIDLRRLTFMDSLGLGVLVRAWQSAVEVGRPTMVLRPGPPQVMRTLAMAGLDTVLPLEGQTVQS
jgi:anti-anti-sigma factor